MNHSARFAGTAPTTGARLSSECPHPATARHEAAMRAVSMRSDRNGRSVEGKTRCCCALACARASQSCDAGRRHLICKTAPESGRNDQPDPRNKSNNNNDNNNNEREKEVAASARSPKTGCKRRQPPKSLSRRRSAQASCVCPWRAPHMVWDQRATAPRPAHGAATPLTAALARFDFEAQLAASLTNFSNVLAMAALGVAPSFFWQRHLALEALRIVEEDAAHFSPKERSAPTCRHDQRCRRIQELTDDNEAKNLASFKRPELASLLRCWDLPDGRSFQRTRVIIAVFSIKKSSSCARQL